MVLRLDETEVQTLEQIAKAWAPTPRGLRVGTAASLLVRLGLSHLAECHGRVPDGDDVGIERSILQEHGIRFVKFIKGMKHVGGNQRGRHL